MVTKCNSRLLRNAGSVALAVTLSMGNFVHEPLLKGEQQYSTLVDAAGYMALVKDLQLTPDQLNKYLGIGNAKPDKANSYLSVLGWQGPGVYKFFAGSHGKNTYDVYIAEKQHMNNWSYVIYGKFGAPLSMGKAPQPVTPEVKAAVDRKSIIRRTGRTPTCPTIIR
jgi:hypothetical protein